MEPEKISTIPQFKSVEEELQFLRNAVLKKEKNLERSGQNIERDDLIKESLEEYKKEIPEEVLHNNLRVPDHEIKNRADDLSQEANHVQIQELIEFTETKGILNTLSIVEKMREWSLEDEFHGFLVEHIKKGLPVRGIKEKGPLYKALHMTLFEIILPDQEKNKEEKTLKTLISGMEQFYAGMFSIAEKNNDNQNYFVLEIANSNSSEEFIFYVSIADDKKVLFEKQLISIFPNAKLIERERDYNIFNDSGVAMASFAKLSSYGAYPIKTYEAYDHDPLNVILNSFSKIPKDGSGAAIQIVFKPKGDLYVEKYKKALKKIEKGEKIKDVLKDESSLGQTFKIVGDLFFSSKKKEDKDKPKEIDSTAIENIKEKIGSQIVATNIRIAVSALNNAEAESIISNIESSFNQFERAGINSLVFKRVPPKKSATFFRNFSFRLFSEDETVPLNLKELTTIFHFQTSALSSTNQLKKTKAGDASAPLDLPQDGTLLGVNRYHGIDTKVYLTDEDRLRHFYTIGQTGTGKSTLLKNMIVQDIQRGNGVCMIDPHGSDVLDVLSNVPPERLKDLVYFDPSHTERPMALNMLEYDKNYPEQKTFVVNELFSIFQKLYGGVPESMGPMFEQYFRNATMLVIEDPESGSTLLDVSRVLSDKTYRMLKLSRCKNPVVKQFWEEIAEKAGGEGALANIVPYITSKFDVFLANDIMRPIIAQEHSSFDFRDIMDNKKILLVNLAKGRLGDINANLIGLILVGKILMSALSRVDSFGKDLPPFYLYIDEFQNITTPAISTILSEARKYKLSLSLAHQFIGQLDEKIKDAVFGNVGTLAVFRVGSDDAEYLAKQFEPVFTAQQIINIDNRKAYLKMLVNGVPVKPFNIDCLPPPPRNNTNVDSLKEYSYLTYGRDREEVEEEVMKKYIKTPNL